MKKLCLISTVVCMILTACGGQKSIPTALPSLTPKPSSTAISSATATVFRTPTPTSTRTPGPLSASGPWLFFKDENQEITLTNWDGSGKHAVISPPLPDGNWIWNTSLSPHGGYFLFRSYQDIAASLETNSNSFENQIIVMKLPEMEIIRTIPLFSDAAKESIKVKLEEFRKQAYYALPALWGVAQDKGASLWSPDGRYLAFSAAINGEDADIYLFDAKENVIKQLTQNQHEAIVWDWSPDSKWIVYQEARIYDSMFSFSDIRGVWAVSLDGEIKRLYTPRRNEGLEGWISDESFIVFETGFEGPMRNLRKINIPNQSVRDLYPGSFSSAAFNPKDQSVIVSLSEGPFESYDVPDGLYTLNAKGGLSTPFVLGNYVAINWEPKLNLFFAFHLVGNKFQPTLLDAQGRVVSQFVGANYQTNPSPNGNWITLEYSKVNKLFSLDGKLVKEIGYGDITWFPDSSGFFRLETGRCDSTVGRLYAHTQASSWEPKLILEGIFACSLALVEL